MSELGGFGKEISMALQFSSIHPQISSKRLRVFLAIFALLLQPFVPLNIPSAFAAGLTVSPATLAVPNASTKVSTINAVGYDSLKLSFNYNAELLDNNDKLQYGWRLVGGSNHLLGSIDGKNENSSNAITLSDETGQVKDIVLPAEAKDKQLEMYFTNTGGTGSDDTVQITAIVINGEKIPIINSTLGTEEFATVDGSYRGISVGFNASNFGTVTDVTVTMKRSSGDDVIKHGNKGVKDLISHKTGPVQVTAPFVVQEGSFTEASDVLYWQPAPATWNSTTVPVKVIISVTDENGTKTAENTTFSQGSPSWPTYESLVPAPLDTVAPSSPTISTPVNEQYFNSKPILNRWTMSTDNVGVVKYQVAYRYDDGHTISDSACPGMVIDGLAVSGCRDETSTSRNHELSESEQGGVRTWVRAYDAAGNTSGWSAPVHYYYDSINPVLTVSNLSSGDFIRTNNSANKLTIKGEYSDNVQTNYTEFQLVKDGNLKNIQMLYGSKPAASVLAEFDMSALGLGDGAYVLQINTTDFAGNVYPQTINFTIDNTAPVVAITAPAVGGIFNHAVEIRGTATDDNLRHYSLQIKRDGAIIYNEIVEKSASFADQLLRTVTDDGAYEVTMAAYDKAGGAESSGNRSEEVVTNFTIDTEAPNTPTHQTPSNTAFINTNDFYFEWNETEDAVGYEIQNSTDPAVDSVTGSFKNVMWTGDYQKIQPIDSRAHSIGASGAWYWQVRAVDAAGNKSPWTTPWKVTIDTDGPVAPLNLGWITSSGTVVANGGVTNDANGTASWDASDSSDTSHYVYKYWNDIDGNQYKPGNEYIVELGNTSLTGSFNQGQGTHHYCVQAVDYAGNTSSCSPFTITFDNTPPALMLNSVSSSTGTSRTIFGTSEPFANIQVTVHSTPQTKSTIADADGNWSLLFEGLEVGDHTVRVLSVDTIGNISEQFSTFTVLAPQTSVVQLFVPPSLAVVPMPVPVTQPDTQEFVSDNPSTAAPAGDESANTVAPSEDSGDDKSIALSTQDEGTGTPLEDTEVLGVMDNIFFGLVWYWWLIVIAALVGGWLLIAAAIRRSRNQV